MVNVVLIIVAVVFLALLALANFYILVYFQHEEDKNTAIFPKVVVILSLTLTAANVLMLPLDVANRNDGGIPMDIIWIVVYMLIGILTVIVIPFAIFYYEAEDPTGDNYDQIKNAIIWESGTLIIFGIITTILYFTIGVAEVPVTKMSAGLQSTDDFYSCVDCIQKTGEIISYRVSIVLYIISMLTFVGVFMFILFGGIGLAALPIDMIQGFKHRPQYITREKYLELKQQVGLRAALLMEKGGSLRDRLNVTGGRPRKRKDRRDYNKFRADVFLLEQEYERLEICYGKSGAGPKLINFIWGWAQLVIGIVGGILSVVWILHIFLYEVLRPAPTPFLNTMFIDLDNVFGLFGTVAYGLFSFYLLWCVIKGNFRFGLRIPFIFSIHPMKVGETMMNSFLFNCLLILLSSMAVVQFCTAAFSQYARFTGIDIIFNVGVRNLRGIKYVWMYYYWALIALAIVSLFMIVVVPFARKKPQNSMASDLP
jgi:LMBR1 domain-containing protein 1